MSTNHTATLFCRRDLRLVNRDYHVYHSGTVSVSTLSSLYELSDSPYAVEESAHEEHSNVHGGTLDDGRDDKNNADDLNSPGSTKFVG